MPFFVQPFAAARISCERDLVVAAQKELSGKAARGKLRAQGVRGDVDDMIFVDDWFVSER